MSAAVHRPAPAAASAAERRFELLALAEPEQLAELAELALSTPSVSEALTVLQRPETGTVVLVVREPVCAERFQLGEVVVTRAEVALEGRRGWAMRMGTDREATLAAAICDAVVAAERPEWAPIAEQVALLCDRTAEAIARRDEQEWAALARTAVAFEALDS